MEEKLYSLREVSVRTETRNDAGRHGGGRAMQILMEAQHAWDNMHQFRKDRERNKRYNYGKQWDDEIHADGKVMSEEEYILSQGNVPLKTNIIRRLVRSVLGVYDSQSKEPTCIARDRDEQEMGETMSTVLQCNMQLNKMKEMHRRTMEEFLISGLAVHRKWYGWRNDKIDCWTDYVQPNNVFIDANMRDFRGWDCALIGEVHDVSFEALCGQFAHSQQDYARLSRIYANAKNRHNIVANATQFGYGKRQNWDFLWTDDYTRCRVIEIWRRESKPRYRCHDYNNGSVYKIELEDYASMVSEVNLRRTQRGVENGMREEDIPLVKAEWFMDERWKYYFLSPFGDILEEGETPYAHHSHPYVFKAYPYIDGEIHSFVSDIIDQQRYVNRLIMMHDWIMRASAKGLLLFPEDALPKGMDINDIADEWARFNGVIVIRKGAKEMPQQIANNATNIGISELLNLQLKLVEDISGVNGALQGKPGYSGVSGTLYAQQTANATTSLLDLLETYSSFVLDGAVKDVKNIQQFYDDTRIFSIAGNRSTIVYDPAKIGDVGFDLSFVESSNTPVYRQIANEFLIQIWQTGQITLEQLLENGNFPFGDRLLQSIRSQKEQMENGEVPDGISPELMQQAQQGADMDAVNKAYGLLKGA